MPNIDTDHDFRYRVVNITASRAVAYTEFQDDAQAIAERITRRGDIASILNRGTGNVTIIRPADAAAA